MIVKIFGILRDDTQIRLLKEILDQIKPDSKVAILAAPTLYCRLFKENPELAKNIYIFEYDKESVNLSRDLTSILKSNLKIDPEVNQIESGVAFWITTWVVTRGL